jgi:thiamine-phosphate pyrophosphorylase
VTDASHRPADRPPARGALPLLYPIIDVDLCRRRGLDPLALATECLSGGARLLQLRQKAQPGGSGAWLELVRGVIASASPLAAAIIVNDRADIAAMAGAAGVHVGQQDLPLAAVRAIAGDRAILGISTHTWEQIDEALEGTADYVAVGPVFTTSTKETGYEPRGLDIIRYAAGRGKPVVAIGGVTAENAAAVLAAGASSVAVIGALLSDADPESRVRELLRSLGG